MVGDFHSKIHSVILNQYLLKFKEEERLFRSITILFIVAGVYGVATLNLRIYELKYGIIAFIPLIFLYFSFIFYIPKIPSLWPWVHYPKLAELEKEERNG